MALANDQLINSLMLNVKAASGQGTKLVCMALYRLRH